MFKPTNMVRALKLMISAKLLQANNNESLALAAGESPCTYEEQQQEKRKDSLNSIANFASKSANLELFIADLCSKGFEKAIGGYLLEERCGVFVEYWR